MWRRGLAVATLLGVLAGCSDDGPEETPVACPSPSAPVSAPPAAGAPRVKMDRPLGGRVRDRAEAKPTRGTRATTGQQHPPAKPTKKTHRPDVDVDDDPETVTETVGCAA